MIDIDHRPDGRPWYYDRQGNGITYARYCELRDPAGQHRDYIIVGQDQIGDVFVSTVWLGMDQNFGGGQPLIFETMTFSDREPWDSNVVARYATEGAAAVGHLLVCALVMGEGREIMPPERA